MDIDRLAVPDRQLFIGHEDAYQSFLPTKQNGIGQDAQFSRLKSVLSGLKAESNLGFLLKYCFDELEFFYPCVNRQDFYNRLFQMLPSASSDNDEEISHKVRQAEYRALAALVCRMLSIAAFLGAGAGPQERLQGDDHYVKASLSWHVESHKLLADSSANDEVSFDAIRAYLLEVIYMTMVQRPRGASKAIAIAIDLSFSIRLHDEQTWTADTPTETEHFRQLWWTVFHLDRRVAFMIGRPYIIRDADFAVGELTTVSRDIYLTARTSTSSFPPCIGNVAPEDLPVTLTEDWFDYFLFSVKWSKIATRAWDKFFSVRSSKSFDADNIELIDALLLKLKSDLPCSLTWDAKRLPMHIYAGDSDRAFRLQLIIFEVCYTSSTR